MNELILGLSEEDYFAAKAASNSMLGLFAKTPLHGKYRLENPPEPTASLIMGKLAHTLVLEPEQFTNRYHIKTDGDPSRPRSSKVKDLIEAIKNEKVSELFYIDDGFIPKKPIGIASEIAENLMNDCEFSSLYVLDPAINRKTKAGKQEHKEFLEANNGKTVVTQKQVDSAAFYVVYQEELNGRTVVKEQDIIIAKNYVSFLDYIDGKEIITEDQLTHGKGMAEAVNNHPTARKLLSKGDAEISLSWIDPDTGEQCKCRIDFNSEAGYLVDLKSTSDASAEEFARSVSKYGYHRQDAFYTDGYEAVFGKKPKAFIFVAVESKPPYAVNCLRVATSSSDQGRVEYKKLLVLYSECKKNDNWCGYPEGVSDIELPPWHKGVNV